MNAARSCWITTVALLAAATFPRAAFTTFLNNGPSSNRVDIVFLDDGYTSSELGTYRTHIGAMMTHLFKKGGDPFPRDSSFFDAHRIDVISAESGADDPTAGLFKNTALDATYNQQGVAQRLLYVSDSKAKAAFSAGLNGQFTADMKLLTVNATQFGGGGGTYAVYAGGNGSGLSANGCVGYTLRHSTEDRGLPRAREFLPLHVVLRRQLPEARLYVRGRAPA